MASHPDRKADSLCLLQWINAKVTRARPLTFIYGPFPQFPVCSGRVGANLRNRLCGGHHDASAQFLDFLELAENCPSLKRQLARTFMKTVDGH